MATAAEPSSPMSPKQLTASPQTTESAPTDTADVPPLSDVERIVMKRLPPSLPRRKNDVYITKRSPFPAQLARCEKLLYSNYNEICVHGLGAAVSRAINLALQLKAKGHGSLEVSCETDTVKLTDDIDIFDDEGVQPRTTQHRNCSVVHIRVYRPDVPLPHPDAPKK